LTGPRGGPRDASDAAGPLAELVEPAARRAATAPAPVPAVVKDAARINRRRAESPRPGAPPPASPSTVTVYTSSSQYGAPAPKIRAAAARLAPSAPSTTPTQRRAGRPARALRPGPPTQGLVREPQPEAEPPQVRSLLGRRGVLQQQRRELVGGDGSHRPRSLCWLAREVVGRAGDDASSRRRPIRRAAFSLRRAPRGPRASRSTSSICSALQRAACQSLPCRLDRCFFVIIVVLCIDNSRSLRLALSGDASHAASIRNG